MQKDCRNNSCRRITPTLVRAGVLVEDPEQPWLDLESGSTLEHLAADDRHHYSAPVGELCAVSAAVRRWISSPLHVALVLPGALVAPGRVARDAGRPAL